MQADYIGAARGARYPGTHSDLRACLKECHDPCYYINWLAGCHPARRSRSDGNGFFLARYGQLSGGTDLRRDYTAVQSVITVFAMLVALISLAVDVIYSLVDPRVRY